MSLIIDIVTLFPEMIAPVLSESILGRAIEQGLVSVHLNNPREYGLGKHHSTDDSPSGGGPGMVFRPEPLVHSLEAIEVARGAGHRILLSPSGAVFNQSMAQRFSRMSHLVIVCGRYEGIDQRVSHYVDQEISIGDFVMTGGEIAALVIVDAVTRLREGVLHHADSATDESFSEGLLEYPQFTKPNDFRGHAIPEVLLSGNHERIRLWRRQQALLRTHERRPDLLRDRELSDEDKELLSQGLRDGVTT